MKVEKVKEMMDACYMAKRVRDMLPELPEGVAPSYIKYLDVIHKLKQKNGKVRISDISDALKLPRPGVTRTIKKMEEKGYVRKTISREDARITYIEITKVGAALTEKYNHKYFSELAESIQNISEEEADCMIASIEKLYRIMCERRGYFE